MRFDDGYLSVVVAQLLQDFDRMFTKFSVLDDSLTMQLALGGQGIALGVMDFLALEFAAGQLVPLFEPMPSARRGYYFATHSERKDDVPLSEFRSWIVNEARAE